MQIMGEIEYNAETNSANCSPPNSNPHSRCIMELTQAYLKEALNYDPATGIFTWRERPREHFPTFRGWRIFNASYALKPAGGIDPVGYVQIGINKSNYRAHRLAWIYVYGENPRYQLDHINGIKTDNRICNLRDVDQQTNTRNSHLKSDNTSGRVGVHWCATAKKWVARIVISGRTVFLGSYLDFESAANARREAETKYGFHENHGRNYRESKQ